MGGVSFFDDSTLLNTQQPQLQTPYVCDPGGLLSRTEVEMLQATAMKLNMTSCFCSSRFANCQTGIRIAVVLLPFVSWNSIRECDPTYTSSSVSTSTILYAQLLSARWQDHCDADVIFVYIQSFQTERLRTPLLIPLFGLVRIIEFNLTQFNSTSSDQWPHLRRFSIPIVTSARETTLIALENAMRHASRLINVDLSPVRHLLKH
uniref:Uncharacterized protein n=1 Tax=Caenorhabditis japonica TaxID=281687 RepID=A0A8R1I5X8_CAEJA